MTSAELISQECDALKALLLEKNAANEIRDEFARLGEVDWEAR